jgi:hypothetical protein
VADEFAGAGSGADAGRKAPRCPRSTGQQATSAQPAAIRRHAWEAHGIEFSVELALEVARSARQALSEHDELEHDRVSRKEKPQEPASP